MLVKWLPPVADSDPLDPRTADGLAGRRPRLGLPVLIHCGGEMVTFPRSRPTSRIPALGGMRPLRQAGTMPPVIVAHAGDAGVRRSAGASRSRRSSMRWGRVPRRRCTRTSRRWRRRRGAVAEVPAGTAGPARQARVRQRLPHLHVPDPVRARADEAVAVHRFVRVVAGARHSPEAGDRPAGVRVHAVRGTGRRARAASPRLTPPPGGPTRVRRRKRT